MKDPKGLSKMDMCRVDLSSLALVRGSKFKIKALSIPDNKKKTIYVNSENFTMKESGDEKDMEFPSHFEEENSVSEAIKIGGNLMSCTEEQFDKFWKEQMEISSSQEDNKPRIIIKSHSLNEDKPIINNSSETEVDTTPKTKVRLVKLSDGRVVKAEKPRRALTRETLPGRDLSKSVSSDDNLRNTQSQIHVNEKVTKGNNIVVYNLINGNLFEVKNRCPQILQAEEKTRTMMAESGLLNTRPASSSNEKSNGLKRRYLSSKQQLMMVAYDKWDPVAKKVCRNPVVTLHRLKHEEISGPSRKLLDDSLMKNSERRKRSLPDNKKSELIIEKRCHSILPEDTKTRQLLKSIQSKVSQSTPLKNQSHNPLKVRSFQEVKSNFSVGAVVENKVPEELKEPNFIRYKSIFNSFVTINNIYDNDEIEKLFQMLMDCLRKLKTTKAKSKGATLTIQLGEISAPDSDKVMTNQRSNQEELVNFENESVASSSKPLNQSPNSENSKIQFLAKFNLLKILSTKVPLNQIEPTVLNKETKVNNNIIQENSSQIKEFENKFKNSNLELNLSVLNDHKKLSSHCMERILVLKSENDLLQKLLKEKNQYIDTLRDKLKLVESICSDVTCPAKLTQEGVVTPETKLFYPEVIMTKNFSPNKKKRKQNLPCNFDCSV